MDTKIPPRFSVSSNEQQQKKISPIFFSRQKKIHVNLQLNSAEKSLRVTRKKSGDSPALYFRRVILSRAQISSLSPAESGLEKERHGIESKEIGNWDENRRIFLSRIQFWKVSFPMCSLNN